MAMAAPMPRVAPVMTAVRPWRENMLGKDRDMIAVLVLFVSCVYFDIVRSGTSLVWNKVWPVAG